MITAQAAMAIWINASIALYAVLQSEGADSPNVKLCCDQITAASLAYGRAMLLEQAEKRGPKS